MHQLIQRVPPDPSAPLSLAKPSLHVRPRKIQLNRLLAFDVGVQFAKHLFRSRNRRFVRLLALLAHECHQRATNGLVIAHAKVLLDSRAELIDAPPDLLAVVL